MITANFILSVIYVLAVTAFTIMLLISIVLSIKEFIECRDLALSLSSFIGLILITVAFIGLLVLTVHAAQKANKDGIPQNQKQYLLDRIENAKREYEKFIIDHPELKED